MVRLILLLPTSSDTDQLKTPLVITVGNTENLDKTELSSTDNGTPCSYSSCVYAIGY